MRKPFYLHKRGRVWYVQFALPSGELASAKSSGLSNKTAAEAWARKRASEFAERRTDLSFGEWSAPFFSPDCPHSKRLAEEGRKLSPYSLRVNRGIFERYIKPDEALARVPLADLRRADLLAFRSRLVSACADRCSCPRPWGPTRRGPGDGPRGRGWAPGKAEGVRDPAGPCSWRVK